jgi:protein-tyrosine-phosphatase
MILAPKTGTNTVKVLFVCNDNACASIIAEALTRRHWGDYFEVASAGIRPLGSIPDEVKRVVLFEIGSKATDNDSELEIVELELEDLFSEKPESEELDFGNNLQSKSLEAVNVHDFELIINFYSESLENLLPASFDGRVENWSPIVGPCPQNSDDLGTYKETMYVLLSALLANPTAYLKEDSLYCKIHHVVMSQEEMPMIPHMNVAHSHDYIQEMGEMKEAEPELFPNTTRILEKFGWEEQETSLQLSCPKCEEAKTLWKEQRDRRAIEREVGLAERLLTEKGDETEDNLRVIGSLLAKQMKIQRGGLYKKVIACLAETMHWTQEEMKMLIQSFAAENERYSQMEEKGLNPFKEIKLFMQSFDPEYYESLWGVSRQTKQELRQSEEPNPSDEPKEIEFEELPEDLFADIEMEESKD